MCPGDNGVRQSWVFLIQPHVLIVYDTRTKSLIYQVQSLAKR